MNKVCNWVFGSFFRTLGRVLVYILIGYCLSFLISDVKLPKLTDLLFVNVQAASYQFTEVISNTSFKINDIVSNTQNSISTSSGTVEFKLESDSLWDYFDSNTPNYGFITVCQGIPSKVNSVNAGYFSRNAKVHNTSIPCQMSNPSAYPNSVLLHLTFDLNLGPSSTSPVRTMCSTGVSTTYCQLDNHFDLSVGVNEAWTLVSYGFSQQPFVFDEADSTLINQNDVIVDSLGNISSSLNGVSTNIVNSTNSIINNQNSNKNDIINNQNTNSQNEINNANQNTQDIIDNQNANNQDLKDNINSQFNECIVGHNIFHFDSPSAVNDNNTTYTITGTGEDFTITNTSSFPKQIRYLFYNLGLIDNQSKLYMYLSSTINSSTSNNDYSIGLYAYTNNCSDLSCFYSYHETIVEPVLTSGASNYNITNFNGKYLVVKLLLSDRNCSGPLDRSCISKNYKDLTFSYSPVSSYESSEEVCTNRLDKTNDTLNDMNSSINNSDSSGATSDASNFFSNFTTDTHGLTGIITAPLNAINSLTSSQCSPLVLPLPFVNENLTLPCMRSIYEQHFGSFMTLYDVITLGIVSYWVMVRIFSLVKDFKNPEHDEIEVVDL